MEVMGRIKKTDENPVSYKKAKILKTLRGGNLLLSDGYLYYRDYARRQGDYWTCVKTKESKGVKCKSRVMTSILGDTLYVVHMSTAHTHKMDVFDIQKRMLTKQSLNQYRLTSADDSETCEVQPDTETTNDAGKFETINNVDRVGKKEDKRSANQKENYSYENSKKIRSSESSKEKNANMAKKREPRDNSGGKKIVRENENIKAKKILLPMKKIKENQKKIKKFYKMLKKNRSQSLIDEAHDESLPQVRHATTNNAAFEVDYNQIDLLDNFTEMVDEHPPIINNSDNPIDTCQGNVPSDNSARSIIDEPDENVLNVMAHVPKPVFWYTGHAKRNRKKRFQDKKSDAPKVVIPAKKTAPAVQNDTDTRFSELPLPHKIPFIPDYNFSRCGLRQPPLNYFGMDGLNPNPMRNTACSPNDNDETILRLQAKAIESFYCLNVKLIKLRSESDAKILQYCTLWGRLKTKRANLMMKKQIALEFYEKNFERALRLEKTLDELIEQHRSQAPSSP